MSTSRLLMCVTHKNQTKTEPPRHTQTHTHLPPPMCFSIVSLRDPTFSLNKVPQTVKEKEETSPPSRKSGLVTSLQTVLCFPPPDAPLQRLVWL